MGRRQLLLVATTALACATHCGGGGDDPGGGGPGGGVDEEDERGPDAGPGQGPDAGGDVEEGGAGPGLPDGGSAQVELITPAPGAIIDDLRPTFRWKPAEDARIALCVDAACEDIEAEMTAAGGEAMFQNCVGAGDHFWRATLLAEPDAQATAGFEIALTEPASFRPAEGSPVADKFISAIPLADGRVLLLHIHHTGATAAIYEPWCETVSNVGPLLTERVGLRASRLADGRVLITGGSNDTSSELFDPATDEFIPGPDMIAAREGHQSTLLADGRVLITGGIEQDTSAEVYDPASNSFHAVGAMTRDRVNAAAVRLQGGEVLVAGGSHPESAGGGTRRSAELFDPDTQTFRATTAMEHARGGFDLLRLEDGRVLASGGHSSGIGVYALEAFDPTTETWTEVGVVPGEDPEADAFQRGGFSAGRLPNGEVLFVGGRSDDDRLSIASIWDPESESLAPTGSTVTGRVGADVVRLTNGRILIAGGNESATPLLELYRP